MMAFRSKFNTIFNEIGEVSSKTIPWVLAAASIITFLFLCWSLMNEPANHPAGWPPSTISAKGISVTYQTNTPEDDTSQYTASYTWFELIVFGFGGGVIIGTLGLSVSFLIFFVSGSATLWILDRAIAYKYKRA